MKVGFIGERCLPARLQNSRGLVSKADGNFMLKTIRRDEFKIMKGMLRAYYEHITDENPDSLISRIYGLHKVIFYRKKHKM